MDTMKDKLLCSKRGARILHDYIVQEFGENADQVWGDTVKQYKTYIKNAPDYGGRKSPHANQIFDSILLLSFCHVDPKNHTLEELEPLSFEMFMGAFRSLGKVVNANQSWVMKVLGIAFRKSNDKSNTHAEKYPADFAAVVQPYDEEHKIARYCFTRCPIADFVKANGLDPYMPLMCNCDHTALKMIHATLVREGTCYTGDICDYMVTGDKNPEVQQYEVVRNEDGLLVSRKKSEAS